MLSFSFQNVDDYSSVGQLESRENLEIRKIDGYFFQHESNECIINAFCKSGLRLFYSHLFELIFKSGNELLSETELATQISAFNDISQHYEY